MIKIGRRERGRGVKESELTRYEMSFARSGSCLIEKN